MQNFVNSPNGSVHVNIQQPIIIAFLTYQYLGFVAGFAFRIALITDGAAGNVTAQRDYGKFELQYN
jgi:hypothetical protein